MAFLRVGSVSPSYECRLCVRTPYRQRRRHWIDNEVLDALAPFAVGHGRELWKRHTCFFSESGVMLPTCLDLYSRDRPRWSPRVRLSSRMGNSLPMLILCADVEVLYVFANMPNGKHTAGTKVLNCGGARGEEPQMNPARPSAGTKYTHAETLRRREHQVITTFSNPAPLRLRVRHNSLFSMDLDHGPKIIWK